MKYCPNCDSENPIEQRLCIACGMDFSESGKLRSKKKKNQASKKLDHDDKSGLFTEKLTLIQIIGVFVTLSGIFLYINRPVTIIILWQLSGLNILLFSGVFELLYKENKKDNNGDFATHLLLMILQIICVIIGVVLLSYWTDDRRLYETNVFSIFIQTFSPF
ncbi:hypothetical protein KAJ27_16415 [bacterium]|nr:hypothetical protein [bacterium]